MGGINVESQEEVEISEQDVIELLGIFTKVPSILLKRMIKGNFNVVNSFWVILRNIKIIYQIMKC